MMKGRRKKSMGKEGERKMRGGDRSEEEKSIV